MSVGQAVRREVSAMNDGIERTIARATELETLVHSEVNALERSYADNELRVRSLVQELTAERDAIVNHAERIRSSIVGAPGTDQGRTVHRRRRAFDADCDDREAFASMIDTRSAALLEKSRASTEAMGSLIAAKTENLLQALNSSGSTISNEFDMRLHNLTSTLDERGEVLLERFAIHASTLDSGVESLNSALEERTRQLNETLSTRTLELNRNIERGQQVIGGSLDTVLDKLSTTLEEKGLSFRQSLQSTADDAIMDSIFARASMKSGCRRPSVRSIPHSTSMCRNLPAPSISAPAASTASLWKALPASMKPSPVALKPSIRC